MHRALTLALLALFTAGLIASSFFLGQNVMQASWKTLRSDMQTYKATCEGDGATCTAAWRAAYWLEMRAAIGSVGAAVGILVSLIGLAVTLHKGKLYLL